MKVKTHKRKGKNKVSVVKQYNRKDRVSSFREAKAFSPKRREKMSERGTALPDGSFPIESKRDLANAISSFGRAKNPEIVKRWIKKRARALGACDMLPKNWK